MKAKSDHLTAAGAEAPGVRITEFWSALGFEVTVRIEYCGRATSPKGNLYAVRSDLVDGWPLRRVAANSNNLPPAAHRAA